jgi:hypothetical protein
MVIRKKPSSSLEAPHQLPLAGENAKLLRSTDDGGHAANADVSLSKRQTQAIGFEEKPLLIPISERQINKTEIWWQLISNH